MNYPSMEQGSLYQAYLIAAAAHLGQLDKGGIPRIHHAQHVSNHFNEPVFQIVGMLHDVIEDSKLTTLEALRYIFGWQVADAVDAISRRENETYFTYIQRVRVNPIARLVKIADLKHNMDRTRWPDMPKSYHEREERALAMLQIDEKV